MRFSLTRAGCLVMAALAASGLVHAAEVRATFDTGVEGFGVSGDGTLAHQVSGGNGHLVLADTSNGTDLYLDAPASLFGPNWSAFLGGTLSFDAVMLNGISPTWHAFGTVVLTSVSGDTVYADLAPDVAGQITEPGPSWKTYSAKLTSDVFDRGSAPLGAVLGSLHRISFSMEAGAGPVEVIGFDNFVVTSPVPEPAAWVLPLAGLVAVTASLRRRKR